mmetsp:Transcript_27382/g.85688  ORF Transcript_27382/g.85688 Transcript_27382/m.85688 type:complete len:214 (-) Transcript_27382:176-817(-)
MRDASRVRHQLAVAAGASAPPPAASARAASASASLLSTAAQSGVTTRRPQLSTSSSSSCCAATRSEQAKVSSSSSRRYCCRSSAHACSVATGSCVKAIAPWSSCGSAGSSSLWWREEEAIAARTSKTCETSASSPSEEPSESAPSSPRLAASHSSRCWKVCSAPDRSAPSGGRSEHRAGGSEAGHEESSSCNSRSSAMEREWSSGSPPGGVTR